MNENNFDNDIEIIKPKKKRQTSIGKSPVLEKKKTFKDSTIKITQKNSINNEIGSKNQLKLNERKTKKKKTVLNKNLKITSIDSLKTTLANISEIIIKQEADILEAVTGCQEPNNYQVYGRLPNGEKIYIFKCREFSSCGMRYFCPVNCREFSMKIKLAYEEEQKNTEKKNTDDEDYENSLIDINKNCKIPCLCCVRPDMKVILSENNLKLGTIEQEFSFCDPVFNIYDKDDTALFYIESDCCQCGFLCRNNFLGKTDEAHFFIYYYNDRSNPAGDICKKAAKSTLSIGDNYSVILPAKATFEEKILLTIAGIMIDYQYFEKNTSSK